jgi:hypothetical protein
MGVWTVTLVAGSWEWIGIVGKLFGDLLRGRQFLLRGGL